MHHLATGSLLALLAWFATTAAADHGEAKIEATVLTQSTTSWNGGALAYPDGPAELTVTHIVIPNGMSLPRHCHNVPLAGVVSKGRLQVKTDAGDVKVFEEGAPVVEVMNTWHQGTALEDTELLVVYAGAEGIPTHVTEDGDPELVGACE